MFLITGATGRTGGAAARELAKRGLPVRALVRNAEKAAPLKAAGVELALGDASNREALAAALQGVNKLLICLPNGEQQLAIEKGLTDAAVAAGVPHILKISSMEAAPHMHSATHQTHWQSEEHIRRSGAAWTMVRPSFYMQNFLASSATIKSEGKFYFPFGDKGAAVLTDSRDAGFFAAHVMATAGHEGKSYDVTSRDKPSFHQVAETFTRVLGRKIEYVPQDPVAYRAYLGKFIASKWHLDAVCEIFAEIARGYTVDCTDTFKQVTGREPMSLEKFIREYLALYQPA